ncbi:MAG: NADH-quinone oxidoreductase subunit NuoF, partial [Deltaproteobacteria bacterium]|nr:NADH-quinone oxidoreductase subunit NuoF [Deltaproteobacteria bacterium]
TCGRASGAMEELKTFQEEIAKKNLKAHVIPVGCMGHCYAEPLVAIGKPGFPIILYGNVNPTTATTLVKHYLLEDNFLPELMLAALDENDLLPSIADFPRFALETRIILRDFGIIDPEDIMHYIARGGYEGLSKALPLEPEEIIKKVKQSGLRGLGGAGYSTGKKWEVCWKTQASEKYVICNADEGDPGSFSDRAVIESSPHQVLEGLIIAGYAVGAHSGYVYVRTEYPLAVKRIKTAIQQARNLGFLGENILGGNFNFNLTVFEGSGAFICGEETALIHSIEGNRGMPRHRPPYPAISGLKNAPTLINNVKTLANIPFIISRGAHTLASIGTDSSKGTAIFAIAGKINNTGLVEVAMGTTLQKLVFDICGGIPKGKQFKAIQIGGPSGGCLPQKILDTSIDFDSLKESGAMMGSGGMVVLDEDDCMVEMARYFLDFTQKESCGKCTFCRIGTKQMLDILVDFTKGEGSPEDIDLLLDLGKDIKNGSLCGLGKTAPNPVLTTIKYFRDEYEAHINKKCCPAKMCRDLISYYILPEKCERSCDACVGSCPTEAIYTARRRIKAIDQEKCVKCGACVDACPPQYDAVVKYSPADTVPPAPEKLIEEK